jgi:hypothetical protein
LLITDLDRPSLLADPVQAEAVRQGTARDGSSMEATLTDALSWRVRNRGSQLDQTAEMTIGALIIDNLRRLLRGRILHERPFSVEGPEQVVRFEPGAPGWKVGEDVLIVSVSADLARQMDSTLQPRRGEYRWRELGGFTLHVAPTEIKDQDGKVTSIVG